jgi:hypothetical protein
MDFHLSKSLQMPVSSFQLPGEMGSVPVALLVGVITIILYYMLVFRHGGGSGDVPQVGQASGLQILVWLIFVFLIIINCANYLLNTDLYVDVKNIFTGNPEVNVVQLRDPKPATKSANIFQQKEVYNIPENRYTYENADAICKANGGKLASYEEIERAYKSGAEWGQYGWSEGQHAFFPTQKHTYDRLQKQPGHEHDRGRPGVNGGYIENPNVRFGVNCYGKKPKINAQSAAYMADQQLFPKTEEEKAFEKRVEFWKKRVPDMVVAPFNSTQYSR